MRKKSIAQVVVGLPVDGPFDYRVSASDQETISIGSRVLVFFGAKKRTGFVIGFKSRSSHQTLKNVINVLDRKPLLSRKDLLLARQMSDYYGCSMGEACETILPPFLRKTRQTDFPISFKDQIKKKKKSQVILYCESKDEERWKFLAQKILQQIEKGRGVLILLADNSLGESIKKEICARCQKEPIILDRQLGVKAQMKIYQEICLSQAPIVIGSRSAVFAPLRSLGLLILIEENHPGFKQEQSPHYHAREIALMRSGLEGCPVLFVDTVPSALAWKMTANKKARRIEDLKIPQNEFQVVNLNDYRSKKSIVLSAPLKNQLQLVLQSGGKALLFLNRKGFSTSTRCVKCGTVIKCEHCESNLVYLFSKKKLICRHCRREKNMIKICPQCKSSYLRYSGTGIEKLESEAARLFPEARICSYEAENKQLPVDYDILIATQAISKHRSDLKADLVAVISFDSEINHLDFHSGQRAFALLVDLRLMAKKKLLVQTRVAENYCLDRARDFDLKTFFRDELKQRKELSLPPFSHILKISLRGKSEERVFDQIHLLCAKLKEQAQGTDLIVQDSLSELIPKLRGQYRFFVQIKGKSVKKMIRFLQKVLKSFKKKSGIIVSIDVE